ncbi:MAG: GFA family protein, partial [Tistlia sp.]
MTAPPTIPATALPLTGGCLCGALRYRVTAAPLDAGYCHCRICQKLSGAPAMVWVTVPRAGFGYTEGEPRVHRSSDWGQREFCAACGSQLVYRTREP